MACVPTELSQIVQCVPTFGTICFGESIALADRNPENWHSKVRTKATKHVAFISVYVDVCDRKIELYALPWMTFPRLPRDQYQISKEVGKIAAE